LTKLPESSPPDALAKSFEYASFWQRLGALLIDGLCLLPATGVQFIPRLSLWIYLVWYVTGIVAAEVYNVSLHAIWGKTVGKMLLGIKVVKTDGMAIGWSRALLRASVDLVLSLVTVASEIIFLSGVDPMKWRDLSMWQRAELREQSPVTRFDEWSFYLLLAWTLSEVIVMLTNKRRRALHDFLAGTVVVKTR
jgi:uncharacterized RDD family membrane protein YckC